MIAAVIIVALLAIVTATYNSFYVLTEIESFQEMAGNFGTEVPKVINYAIENKQNEAEAVETLMDNFNPYAHKIDPNFGIMYIFKDTNGTVHIMNSLNKKSIEIEFSEEYKGTKTKISLLPSDEKTEGDVCFEGICTKVSTEVSNFGTGFYSTNLKQEEINGAKMNITFKNDDGTTLTNFIVKEDNFNDFFLVMNSQSDPKIDPDSEEVGNMEYEEVATIKFKYISDN